MVVFGKVSIEVVRLTAYTVRSVLVEIELLLFKVKRFRTLGYHQDAKRL